MERINTIGGDRRKLESAAVKVVSRFTQSLQMRRFIHACKMFEKYKNEEEKAMRLKMKWGKKVRYYDKFFGAKK